MFIFFAMVEESHSHTKPMMIEEIKYQPFCFYLQTQTSDPNLPSYRENIQPSTHEGLDKFSWTCTGLSAQECEAAANVDARRHGEVSSHALYMLTIQAMSTSLNGKYSFELTHKAMAPVRCHHCNLWGHQPWHRLKSKQGASPAKIVRGVCKRDWV